MSAHKSQTWAALSCAAALATACMPLPSADVDGGRAASGSDNDAGVAVESQIGSAGGKLVSAEGLAEVDVPPNALNADITLQAREIAADQLPAALPLGASAAAVELTPHGTLFDAPVTIKINYDPAADTSNMVVMRLDDASDPDWEVMPGATFKDGIASVESTTFSYYTVVTYPEPSCSNIPAAVKSCSGSCSVSQYCSTAATCLTIGNSNLCDNKTVYAIHGGETTVDDPAADSMASALASLCGSSVTLKTATLTDGTALQACTNEPIVGGGNTLVAAGAPFTNLMLRYLDRRISPVYIDTDGTKQQFKSRDGTELYAYDPAILAPGRDVFLVQIFQDTARGALVVSAFGREGPGTKAGAWYFKNKFLPTLVNTTTTPRLWGTYAIVDWTDTSGDLAPGDNDTWSVKKFDSVPAVTPPPPPVVVVPPPSPETPFLSNVNGTITTGQTTNIAAGYKFTPRVAGKVTALGGCFTGSKTVKLFQGSSVLATATVVGACQSGATAAANWVYKALSPAISVAANTQYTVAVYTTGSGGVKIANITTLPQQYGNIRIDAPTSVSTATTIFNSAPANAVPTANSTDLKTMLGVADITFLAN